jgi:hypothetical protein
MPHVRVKHSGSQRVSVGQHGSRPEEPSRADLAGQLTLPPPGRADADPDPSFLRLRQNKNAPRVATTRTAVTTDV